MNKLPQQITSSKVNEFFKITCKQCNSDDVDTNYDNGTSELDWVRANIMCNNCGNEFEIGFTKIQERYDG